MANKGISKNFGRDTDAPVSINFCNQPGAPSSSAYEPPANAPTSRSFAPTPGNPAISKNFDAADAAARAAQRTQGGQTHSVMRRGWR
jgi:hypothetical protein